MLTLLPKLVAIGNADTEPLGPATRGCPLHAAFFSHKRSERHVRAAGGPLLEVDAQGEWHVYGYEIARAILRTDGTRQAGFKAELFERLSSQMRAPVLYQHSHEHHRQRRLIARYFTPKTTSASYRRMMESYADVLIAGLRRSRRVDLSQLSLTMAVQVAAHIVGLTNSRMGGMAQRIAAFLREGAGLSSDLSVRGLISRVRGQLDLLKFLYLDVVPAMNARRASPRDDIISHLLSQGATLPEVLSECVTYAAAGMVTTREFICMAAWHLLAHPTLRELYLSSSEPMRHRLLHEALRLEPVVGELKRRTTAPLTVQTSGVRAVIPSGALIHIHIGTANLDTDVVGENPRAICPERPLRADCSAPALLSFGEGEHRCPGAFVAIQESDILLLRLLSVEGLRIEKPPTVSWGDITQGYELRDFVVATT